MLIKLSVPGPSSKEQGLRVATKLCSHSNHTVTVSISYSLLTTCRAWTTCHPLIRQIFKEFFIARTNAVTTLCLECLPRCCPSGILPAHPSSSSGVTSPNETQLGAPSYLSQRTLHIPVSTYHTALQSSCLPMRQLLKDNDFCL